MATEVRLLTPNEVEAGITSLAAILLDAVTSGASVSFLENFTLEMAKNFWIGLLPAVNQGQILILGALRDGQLVGTVQLHINTPPNQPHRADVAKLLVHRSARRLGIARKLMQYVEEVALDSNRWLLTLDTVPNSPAEQLYLSLGYVGIGIIPGYALLTDGRLGDTKIFYKQLASG
ncbi:MAG: GNAT family N-acetyltransferase [Anaerolineae bacterium]|nr:GNAT family N-acetyltransferase [Gloeobacterales cyanobacterium ES-bin-313]